MKLLDEIRVLREELPELKIRQELDAINRKLAVIELPECKDNLIIVFEHDCMVMRFEGTESVYSYRENDFRYMIDEIRLLFECEILALSVEVEGRAVGGKIISSGQLSEKELTSAVSHICIMNGIENPHNVKAYLKHAKAKLDYSIHYSRLSTGKLWYKRTFDEEL